MSASAESLKVGGVEANLDLHTAAKIGDVNRVRQLLGAPNGKALVNKRDKLNREPIHMAAYGGHTAILQLLLDNGANLDSAALDGMTPLHFAAQAGHLDSAVLLCEKGAKVNAILSKGRKTVLHLACGKGHMDVAVFLARNGADITVKNSRKETPLDVVPNNESKQNFKEKLQESFELHKALSKKRKKTNETVICGAETSVLPDSKRIISKEA